MGVTDWCNEHNFFSALEWSRCKVSEAKYCTLI